MTGTQDSRIPFWIRPSTLLVTIFRIALAVVVHGGLTYSLHTTNGWLHSLALKSILIKPSLSLSHVREALAIRSLTSGRFSDSYAAHPRIQLPPLLLATLTPLATSEYANLYLALLCIVLDLALATMMESIGYVAIFTNRVEAVDDETNEQEQLPEAIRPPKTHIFAIQKQTVVRSLIPMDSLPTLAAQLYYWSPVTIASGTVYSCFQMLPGFFLVACFFVLVRRRGTPFLATFFLAVATYLELHHVAFSIPLMSLTSKASRSQQVAIAVSYVFWFGCLQGLSAQLVGPTIFSKVLQGCYGVGWRTIRPNLSVQWYLAMQLFSRFREYFGALILGLPYIAVVPISTRLYKYPIVLLAIYSMLWSMFRPVETLFDANLALCFFLLCPRSLARMGFAAFVALCSLGVPVVLNVVDHWMWLGPNTGNANYMFFQCLAYNVFLGILLGQFCKASLERDKALRLAVKERGKGTHGPVPGSVVIGGT